MNHRLLSGRVVVIVRSMMWTVLIVSISESIEQLSAGHGIAITSLNLLSVYHVPQRKSVLAHSKNLYILPGLHRNSEGFWGFGCMSGLWVLGREF